VVEAVSSVVAGSAGVSTTAGSVDVVVGASAGAGSVSVVTVVSYYVSRKIPVLKSPGSRLLNPFRLFEASVTVAKSTNIQTIAVPRIINYNNDIPD
jgi:hypothetical protein